MGIVAYYIILYLFFIFINSYVYFISNKYLGFNYLHIKKQSFRQYLLLLFNRDVKRLYFFKRYPLVTNIKTIILFLCYLGSTFVILSLPFGEKFKFKNILVENVVLKNVNIHLTIGIFFLIGLCSLFKNKIIFKENSYFKRSDLLYYINEKCISFFLIFCSIYIIYYLNLLAIDYSSTHYILNIFIRIFVSLIFIISSQLFFENNLFNYLKIISNNNFSLIDLIFLSMHSMIFINLFFKEAIVINYENFYSTSWWITPFTNYMIIIFKSIMFVFFIVVCDRFLIRNMIRVKILKLKYYFISFIVLCCFYTIFYIRK